MRFKAFAFSVPRPKLCREMAKLPGELGELRSASLLKYDEYFVPTLTFKLQKHDSAENTKEPFFRNLPRNSG